jgi:hypothetical protein
MEDVLVGTVIQNQLDREHAGRAALLFDNRESAIRGH